MGDGYAGWRLGRQYQMRYRQAEDGQLAVALDHEHCAGQGLEMRISKGQFEKWWLNWGARPTFGPAAKKRRLKKRVRKPDAASWRARHSWLNRFHQLFIHWAKKPANYLAMLHFACARITWLVVG